MISLDSFGVISYYGVVVRSHNEMKKTGNAKLDSLIDDWRASGRSAWVSPLVKLVSLNGGARKSYRETLATLNAWAHKERPLEAERLITKGRLGGGTFRWIPASEVEAL